MKRVYVFGFGWMERKHWKELIHRQVRYCGSEDGLDVYEVTDEQADDFGALYATNVNED